MFSLGVDTSLFPRLRSTLSNYAKATGGESWFPSPQSAIELCYSLSSEAARNQYVLGYASTNKRPVGRDGLPGNQGAGRLAREWSVRHRKGYHQSSVKTLKIQSFKLTGQRFNTILVAIGQG